MNLFPTEYLFLKGELDHLAIPRRVYQQPHCANCSVTLWVSAWLLSGHSLLHVFKDSVFKGSLNIRFCPLHINICVVTDVDIVAIKQTLGCGLDCLWLLYPITLLCLWVTHVHMHIIASRFTYINRLAPELNQYYRHVTCQSCSIVIFPRMGIWLNIFGILLIAVFSFHCKWHETEACTSTVDLMKFH